ncbi:unnamed protein product, partial [Ranitomeya imitator]
FLTLLQNLLKNRVYLLFLLVTVLQFSAFVGFMTFLPKYLEQQYGKPASEAIFLIGVYSLPVIAVGYFLGGFLMKKYKTSTFMAAKLGFGTSVTEYLLYLLAFTMVCKNAAMAGLTVTYDGVSHYPIPRVSVSLSCTPSVSVIILYPECQCHYPVPRVSVSLSCTLSVSVIILYPECQCHYPVPQVVIILYPECQCHYPVPPSVSVIILYPECERHYPVSRVSVSLSCTPSVSAIIQYPECQCHYSVPPVSVPLSCTPSVSVIILYPKCQCHYPVP